MSRSDPRQIIRYGLAMGGHLLDLSPTFIDAYARALDEVNPVSLPRYLRYLRGYRRGTVRRPVRFDLADSDEL